MLSLSKKTKVGPITMVIALSIALCAAHHAEGTYPAEGSEPVDRLALEIILDSPTYVEGNEIAVTMVYINTGLEPIRYQPLEYSTSWRCVATGSDAQQFPEPPFVGEYWGPPFSARLEPGESDASIYWFNSDANLPPGDYVMECRATQPPAWPADEFLPDERVVPGGEYLSNVIPFIVLPLEGKAPQSTRLALNGEPLDAKPEPFRVKNFLMASAESLEQAGVKATQDKAKQEVSLTRGDASVTLPVARWPKEMQDKHPPAIPTVGGGLLVPVRYVAESLGLRVHWDPKTQTANILTG